MINLDEMINTVGNFLVICVIGCILFFAIEKTRRYVYSKGEYCPENNRTLNISISSEEIRCLLNDDGWKNLKTTVC